MLKMHDEYLRKILEFQYEIPVQYLEKFEVFVYMSMKTLNKIKYDGFNINTEPIDFQNATIFGFDFKVDLYEDGEMFEVSLRRKRDDKNSV